MLKEVVAVEEGRSPGSLEAVCASRCSRALWSATSMANVLSGPWLQLLPMWQLPDLLR